MTSLSTTVPDASFFARVGEPAAAELMAVGTRRGYPAGAVLFIEGDRAHEVLIVLTGDLKVVVVSADGRDVVLDLVEPGALVGEWAVLDGGVRSATVSALTDAEVLTVPAVAFRAFLDRHPDVLSGLVVDMVHRLRRQVRSQLELGAGDALGRVCARLVRLADRYGQPSGPVLVVRSPLSQADLAAWTGLSREAVVKALRDLRRLGWIANRGPDITIHDVAAIRRRATQ